MLRRVALGAVVLGLFLSISQPAIAQAPPKGTVMKLNGSVSSVTRDGIFVAGGGTQYAVFFDNRSKINVSGTAAPEFLTAGTYVQLDSDLDAKGVPTGEVTKLQIIENNAINAPGVYPEGGPDAKPGEAGKYFIRGVIKTNKAGTITVAAGTKPMTFKLGAALSVPVTISDWSLASPNDSISGDGESFPPVQGPNGMITPVWCERMEIKAAAPITKKKKGRK